MHHTNKIGIVAGYSIVCLLTLAPMCGCSRETSHRPYVARVDMAELTEDEIAGDTTGGVHRRAREYVNQWIINELLYQEALRRDIPETDGFQKQVNATRRSLAIAGLLERELYSISDTLLVSNDSVFAYFKLLGVCIRTS